MVGMIWRGVLTPGYFEPCNFPSIKTPKAVCSGIFEWHILATGASHVALVVKNLPANAGDKRDASLIPGSGRSPGEGNGILFQYSCWENPRDRGAWRATIHGVAKSHTWLNIWAQHTSNILPSLTSLAPSLSLCMCVECMCLPSSALHGCSWSFLGSKPTSIVAFVKQWQDWLVTRESGLQC